MAHPNTHSETWANWVAAAAAEIVGFRIDALSVPQALDDPARFMRDTWVFHLSKKGAEPRALECSLQPQNCGLRLLRGKGPKKASRSTLPAFLQKIRKEMVGQVVQGFGITPGERFVHLRTQTELVWILIPAAPNAYWINAEGKVQMTYRSSEKRHDVVFQQAQAVEHIDPWWVPPAKTPDHVAPPRKANPEAKRQATLQQMRNALEEMERGPDWRTWGESMQLLWTHPSYGSEAARRDLVQSIDACFEDAKKADRRREELQKRLRQLEQRASVPDTRSVRSASAQRATSEADDIGLRYVSIEGREIWVGRNSTENRKLVLHHAKGSDIWVHVKGRPGAHVIVRSTPGKPPSLETLLDAAVLALIHSKGLNWGKTEVDYTERKHVKATPSTGRQSGPTFDVHFSQNKTLVVDAGSEEGQQRLRRLSEGRINSKNV